MGVIRFRAQLQRRGPAAAVVLDEIQVATVGEGAKRFPVVATVNGYTWQTSVSRMGGEFLLGLNREVRTAAGETRTLLTSVERLELSPEAALAVQKRYFREYGTTLRGLMTVDRIDPHEFMAFVHDVDLSCVPANPVV